MKKNRNNIYYHIMLLPGMVFLTVFSLVPMGGLIMAFQNFQPAKGIFGSRFVGLENFSRIFMLPDFYQIFANTIIISVSKIVLGMAAAVLFAVLLNECRFVGAKRAVQTAVYLPHFLSWVILAVMFRNIFSYTGVMNHMIQGLGKEPVMFLASNDWFRPIIILGDVWKEFGYNAIVYVAAMTGIDPSLYEAAEMDGAGRLKKIWHITIPGLMPTIVLMTTLNLGHVLNAGFDQILNLYSPLVYETGDIIDTYVYRVGLMGLQYSFGTAVGFFKSVFSSALLIVSYKLADRFAGYRVF